MKTASCFALAAAALIGPTACGVQRATAVEGTGAGGGAGALGAGGSLGGGGSGGAPDYTLVVDTPQDNAVVSGVVAVTGRASGFVNVEVWDAEHQHPPLAQVVPRAGGAFETSIDTAALPTGPTSWTVFAWDSPPDRPFTRDANVPLNLTIERAGDGGPNGQTIGTGDIDRPAVGPGPTEGGRIGGAPFVLVKNWDFGTAGTIKDASSLISEFQFHDQFNTIANGTDYGAVIVAPTGQTAIPSQPVEEPARPTREWTAGAMRAHVRPLSAAASSVSVSAHDTGCGSVIAKWKLPNGGSLLGRDLLWEVRARMPVPLPAYWFSISSSGNKYENGAGMNVMQSFGTPNIYPPPEAFHVRSVGGSDEIDYASWPNGLDAAMVPANERDLREWHVWSWHYRADDSFVVYYDGHVVQRGTLHWTLGGGNGGEPLELFFLIDIGWGHTLIGDVNISLPAADFPITFELDYSRVYLRR
jgi:hypothetical protein